MPKLYVIDKTINADAMQLLGKTLNDANYYKKMKENNQ